MGESLLQRSFAGGEWAPALAMRADLAGYLSAARAVRNFVVRRHGGAANRAGTRFCQEVKTSSQRTYLARFVFNADQTYVIEAGNLYFRFFFADGSPVETSPGVPFELSTPYATADLPTLQYVQSADVVTLTHPSYAPRELRRTGHTSWTLVAVTTAPSILPPVGLGSSGSSAGSQERHWVVTAVKAETLEESEASAAYDLTSITEPTPTAPITLTWTAVAGAVEYNIYCDPYGNQDFGFIGRAKTNSFKDPGLLPDFFLTPPQARLLFVGAGNFPATAAYYQQRRLFANSNLAPEQVWGSRIGFYSNFGISSPLQDDDAVTFTIAGNEVQPVRYLIGLNRLVLLSAAGEWKIQGDSSGALLPTAINPDQQGYNGAAWVRPVVVNQTIVYVQARGNIVRDLNFDDRVAGLNGRDLTIRAAHLFEGKTVERMAFAQLPHSTVWAVSSDGRLLGLTYLPEEELFGWHRHDTGAEGVFEDVITVPDGPEDAVFVIVRRRIGGVTKRYVERFESRLVETLATDAWFVDSGLRYSGPAVLSVSGLGHLEGQQVVGLANGVKVGPLTVTGGAVTLPSAASNVVLGLAITADLETLDLDVQGTSLRDQRKSVPNVKVIVEASARGFAVGPDAGHLRTTRPEQWDTSATIDGAVEATIDTTWSQTGRVLLRHTDPTPLTVLGIIPNVVVGG